MELVLTLSCPDQPGIVARVTKLLYDAGANIDESAQFGDPRSDTFFMRITMSLQAAEPAVHASLQSQLERLARDLDMTFQLRDASATLRTVVMVSKFGHCLNDLLFRWRSGSLAIDVVAIVSNHPDLAPLAASYHVPFHHIPVTPQTKDTAEDQLRQLLTAERIDLVVLARYMQILSDGLAEELGGRAINIHHSFLPSFKGAKPYHQAYARGVKIIGATAHYVTPSLDEGPIIAQDVIPVDHRQLPDDLVAIGEECESRVLARAVRWHSQSRVLMNVDRTVVFN